MAIQSAGSSAALQGGGGLSIAGSGPIQRAAGSQPAAGGQPAAGSLQVRSYAPTTKLSVGVPKVTTNPAAQQTSTATDALLRAAAALAANRQPPPVYAPSLDFGAINAKSRAAAEGAVNPFYTKQINDFVQQQAVAQQQRQVQYGQSVKALEEGLRQTTEGNDITKARTAEDVAAEQAATNTEADQFQTDSGQQFNQDRIAQAKAVASAGLTGGLGAQQAEASQVAHNTEEGRQQQQVEKAKADQELFKTRKFEDIALSNANAQTNTGLQKEKEKFDLDSYIENQAGDLKQKQNDLEVSRQQAMQANQRQQQSLLVRQFVDAIANPAQRQAALQAYGGLL